MEPQQGFVIRVPVFDALKLIRMPLDEARLNAERDAIAECLQSAGKNVSHAAKQLRISRMTLYRLMAKHRISA